MITRHNRACVLRAAFALLGGCVCVALAYLFFRYIPVFVAGQFGKSLPNMWAIGIAGLGMLAVFASGYNAWRKRGGLQGYHESALYHDLGDDTAGAFVVDFYAHRVTAPAYALSQTFLAGPLLLLKSATFWASRLPNDHGLEGRLGEALAKLRAAKRWQSLADFPEERTEFLYLAQMGLIDFSANKGAPRIKARALEAEA